MIVENICCQGSIPGYGFYFRSNVLGHLVSRIQVHIEIDIGVLYSPLYSRITHIFLIYFIHHGKQDKSVLIGIILFCGGFCNE